MKFRFPGFDVPRHYTPRASSSSSSNYSYIPGHATNDGGEKLIADQLMEIHREIEKELIREEIIAAEIERQIALEAEVRRRERMALPSGGGYSSSIKIETPLQANYHHHPFNPQMLHGEWFTPEIKETTTYKPKDGKTEVIGLGKPSGATLSDSNSEAGLSPSLAAVPGSSGGNKKTSKKKIAEEWNCMVCGVSVTSEHALSEHLSGEKHQAQMQASKAYNNNDADIGSGKIKKQSSKIEISCKSGGTLSDSKQEAGWSPSQQAVLGSSGISSNISKKKKEGWNCIVCGIHAISERMLSDHLSGKKHQAQMDALKAGNDVADIGFGKIKTQSSKIENSCKSGATVSGSKGKAGVLPSPPAVLSSSGVSSKSSKRKINEEWNCIGCGIHATSEHMLSAHLAGKKHQAKMKAAKAYENNPDIGSGKIKKQSSSTENSCKSGATMPDSKQEAGVSLSPPAVIGLSGVSSNISKKKKEGWNCIVCGIHAISERMLSDHLSGKKHQAQMDALKAGNYVADIGFGKIKTQSSKIENSCKSGATVSGSKGKAGVLPSPPAVLSSSGLSSKSSKKKINEERQECFQAHLAGKKHQAKMKAAKAYENNLDIGSGKIKKQSSSTENSCKSGATMPDSKQEAGVSLSPPAVIGLSGVSSNISKKKKEGWNCIVCGIHAISERMLSDHLSGKMHQAQMDALKASNDVADIGFGKIKTQSSKIENSCKSGATVSGSKGKAGVLPSPPAVLSSSGVSSKSSKKKINEEWNCIGCGIHATSEHMLSTHLAGKKHQAKMKAAKAYKNNPDIGSGKIKKQSSSTENSCKSGATMPDSKQEAGVSLSPPAVIGLSGVSSNTSKNKIKEEWNCIICGIHATSEHTLSEHLSGEKHQAQMEASKAYNKDTNAGFGKIKKQQQNTENSFKLGATLSGSKREAGVPPLPPASLGSSGGNSNASKKKIKEWTCMVCYISVTSERGLSEHLSGKRHRAQLEASKACNDNDADIVSGKIKKQPSNTENLGKSAPIDLKEGKKITDENTSDKFRFWCSMCQAGAQDEKIMSSHKNGKKHMKNLLKTDGTKTKPTGRESI